MYAKISDSHKSLTKIINKKQTRFLKYVYIIFNILYIFMNCTSGIYFFNLSPIFSTALANLSNDAACIFAAASMPSTAATSLFKQLLWFSICVSNLDTISFNTIITN